MADNIVILNAEQLRRLAKLIYYQEVDATNNIKFSSEPELAKYLRDCKNNYDSVVGLLESGGEVERKFQDDGSRAPIAQDIFSYIVYCANSALQAVQNYTLRMSYLDKISEHATALINGLQELDPENVINVRRLAKDAVLYRNAMLEYTRKSQSIASRNFSKWLKDSGLRFEELVERYQTKLKFDGPFENLEEPQKLQGLRTLGAIPNDLEPVLFQFVPSIRSGSFADIRPRRDMEDEHIKIDDLSGHFGSMFSFPSPSAFYGIFDGHGGPDAATYIKRHASKLFFEDVEFPQAAEADNVFVDSVEKCVRKAFLLADLALADDYTISASSGTTALAVLIFRRLLLVANAGDCRAVLCRKGEAVHMSQVLKHTPSTMLNSSFTEELDSSVHTPEDNPAPAKSALKE